MNKENTKKKKTKISTKKIGPVPSFIKKAKTNPNFNKNKTTKKGKKKEIKRDNKKKITKASYQHILEELDKNPNYVPEDKEL